MVDLKKEEEELKLLVKKIDSEILKIQNILEEIDTKQNNIQIAVTITGLQAAPINIFPHSDNEQNLAEELKQQILELNKSKNFLTSKLDIAIKEEELLAELKKQFGEAISLKKTRSGEFELEFKDKETQKAFDELEKSKKSLKEIKEIYQNIIEEP